MLFVFPKIFLSFVILLYFPMFVTISILFYVPLFFLSCYQNFLFNYFQNCLIPSFYLVCDLFWNFSPVYLSHLRISGFFFLIRYSRIFAFSFIALFPFYMTLCPLSSSLFLFFHFAVIPCFHFSFISFSSFMPNVEEMKQIFLKVSLFISAVYSG